MSVDADSPIEAGLADLMMCLVEAGQYQRGVGCPFDEGRSFQKPHTTVAPYFTLGQGFRPMLSRLIDLRDQQCAKGPNYECF